MSDILSQEEIDRLLNATGDEAPAGAVDDLSPAEVEAVEKVTRVFFASANSALAAMLAVDASVTEGIGQAVDLADLAGEKGLLARFPFRSGFQGEMAFLLRHRDAGVLADLILGGDGAEKDALDESDLDALKEALTQVAGSGAPTISATLGREVGFATPEVAEVDAAQLTEALPWGHAFLGVGSIKVADVLDAPLRLLLPVEVAREIAGLLSADDGAEQPREDSPAPAAEPPPTAGGTQPVRTAVPTDIRNIDLILDIEVEAMVRLGEARMPLREIQRLRPGSIMDLDKDTEALVELVVNDRVLAKGELVVVGTDHFALRITEIEAPSERIRKLGPS